MMEDNQNVPESSMEIDIIDDNDDPEIIPN